jgi:heme exporter protein CcmD
MTYLVVAYGFGVAVLGGYLAWMVRARARAEREIAELRPPRT